MNTSSTARAATAANAARPIVPRRVERIFRDPRLFAGSFDASSAGVCTITSFRCLLLGQDGYAGTQLGLVTRLGSAVAVVQGVDVLDELADDLVLSRRVIARTRCVVVSTDVERREVGHLHGAAASAVEA